MNIDNSITIIVDLFFMGSIYQHSTRTTYEISAQGASVF